MGKIIRYFLIAFFIVTSLVYLSTSFVTSFVSLLIVISLVPNVYRKFNKENNRKLQIFLPICLFLILCLIVPNTSVENGKIENNDAEIIDTSKVEEVVEDKVSIESLEFLDKNIELDISETKELILNVMPKDAMIEEIEIVSSDENVLKVEKNKGEIEKGNVSFKIIPVSEGEVVISAKAGEIKSFENIVVKVVDNARIEEEKRQQEEKERVEAQKQNEVQATTVIQESKKANTQSSTNYEGTTQSNSKSGASSKNSSQSNSNNSGKQTDTSSSYNSSSASKGSSSATNYNGQTVYITPSGEKYHYLSTCGGKNSTAIDLDTAKARGYGPCKKCVH